MAHAPDSIVIFIPYTEAPFQTPVEFRASREAYEGNRE